MKSNDIVLFKGFGDCPLDSYKIYNSKFLKMKLDDILIEIRFEYEFKPFGYKHVGFCRDLAMIFIWK